MNLLFELNKKHKELAKQEVKSFYKIKEEFENYIIIEVNSIGSKYYERFAYSKAIYKILFKCFENELEKQTKAYNWNFIESFAVRNINNKTKEKHLADLIPSHNVNLRKPDNIISFLFIKGKTEKTNITYCLEQLWENPKDFVSREPKKRPVVFPTTMDPRLSKVMVNLTGLKNGIIYDPFCGIGGTILEAGLLGFKVIANDIENKFLKGCKTNLEYYKVKDYKLTNEDALAQSIKADAIVTDIPYGKNTKNIDDISVFITKFLSNSYKNKIKKLVIGIPGNVDIQSNKYKILFRYNYYIHKSMSKNIFVLEIK